MHLPTTLDLVASAVLMSAKGHCRYNPRPESLKSEDGSEPPEYGDHHACPVCDSEIHCDRGALIERVKAFIIVIGVLNAFAAPYIFYGAYIYCLIAYKVEIPLMEPILGFLAVVILGFLGFLPWTGVVIKNIAKGIVNSKSE